MTMRGMQRGKQSRTIVPGTELCDECEGDDCDEGKQYGSAEGQPCEKGQTAARSGCTPAEGDRGGRSGSEAEGSKREKPVESKGDRGGRTGKEASGEKSEKESKREKFEKDREERKQQRAEKLKAERQELREKLPKLPAAARKAMEVIGPGKSSWVAVSREVGSGNPRASIYNPDEGPGGRGTRGTGFRVSALDRLVKAGFLEKKRGRFGGPVSVSRYVKTLAGMPDEFWTAKGDE